ncbi:hypothetical protein J3R83DRAFT_10724 [Lanmaoa asiatica]|nr:hypothetical protein J3R83DRAFT_10724 [Lanmaoa asiatica]
MLMNQVLDSLRDPDDRSRPLKRSASVASLPTPPRTHHKRSRSRARSYLSRHDSDGSGSASELDDDLGGGYAKHFKRVKMTRNSKSASDNDEQSEVESPDRKKRRTLGVLPGHDEEEEDENAFWTGRGGPSCEGKKGEEGGTGGQNGGALAVACDAPLSRKGPCISTTIEKVAIATKIWPKRDSPNNPFLIESNGEVKLRSEWDSSDDDEEVVGEARVREGTPTPIYEEKPTITYVFRGQKATFHNPLHGLAAEVVAASRLPIDHPDYEAAEACPPKRLFFSAGQTKVPGS